MPSTWPCLNSVHIKEYQGAFHTLLFLTAGKDLCKSRAGERLLASGQLLKISGANFGRPQKVYLLVIRSLPHILTNFVQT